MDRNESDFGRDVKEFFTLQQKLKEIADEAKQKRTPIKDRVTNLEVNIKTYMKESNTQVCKFQDQKLEVQSVERYGSLTQKTLLAALNDYFQNEVVANECFEFIRNKLGKREVDILRKTKIRQPKRKAPAKPKAAAKKQKASTNTAQEEDQAPEDEVQEDDELVVDEQSESEEEEEDVPEDDDDFKI